MAPCASITVAAWVKLDDPNEHEWGGIVSFIQDNGSDKRASFWAIRAETSIGAWLRNQLPLGT